MTSDRGRRARRAEELRKASGMLKVFNTYELIEAILLRLPMQDILTCQALCKVFFNVIARSKRLQQRLFRVPTSNYYLNNTRGNNKFEYMADHETVMSPDGARLELHPLIHKIFPDLLGDNPLKKRDEWNQIYPSYKGRGNIQHAEYLKEIQERIYANITLNSRMVRGRTGFYYKHPLAKKPGSWQRMYLTQPPVRTVDYIFGGVSGDKIVRVPHVVGASPEGRLLCSTGLSLGVLAGWQARLTLDLEQGLQLKFVRLCIGETVPRFETVTVQNFDGSVGPFAAPVGSGGAIQGGNSTNDDDSTDDSDGTVDDGDVATAPTTAGSNPQTPHCSRPATPSGPPPLGPRKLNRVYEH